MDGGDEYVSLPLVVNFLESLLNLDLHVVLSIKCAYVEFSFTFSIKNHGLVNFIIAIWKH